MGALLAVGVGVFARELVTTDTSGGRPLLVKALVQYGIEAFMEGKYRLSVEHLTLAIHEDDLFAEAYMVRSLVHLGLGEWESATNDARFAKRLADDERLEPRGWEGELAENQARARLMTSRVMCVAREGAEGKPLSREDSSRLVRAFQEVAAAESCDAAREALSSWSGERRPHSLLLKSMARCREHWRCAP